MSMFLLPPTGNNRRPPVYALVVLKSLLSFGSMNSKTSCLYDEDSRDVRLRYKPDAIKGDMDSIRTEVLDFYVRPGTKVVDESHDQDITDLHKCVKYICENTKALDKLNLCILVSGALGGRFDHEAGNINVLFRFSAIRIILLSGDRLIYLLPSTHRHEIHIQHSVKGPSPLWTHSIRIAFRENDNKWLAMDSHWYGNGVWWSSKHIKRSERRHGYGGI